MAGRGRNEGGRPPEPVSCRFEDERPPAPSAVDQLQPILVDVSLDLPPLVFRDREMQLASRNRTSLTFAQVESFVDLNGIRGVERFAREADGLAVRREADIERSTSFTLRSLRSWVQIAHILNVNGFLARSAGIRQLAPVRAEAHGSDHPGTGRKSATLPSGMLRISRSQEENVLGSITSARSLLG